MNEIFDHTDISALIKQIQIRDKEIESKEKEIGKLELEIENLEEWIRTNS